jgi:hypothetical protein
MADAPRIPPFPWREVCSHYLTRFLRRRINAVTLLDRAAKLSPLERLETASRHLAELRRFRPR